MPVPNEIKLPFRRIKRFFEVLPYVLLPIVIVVGIIVVVKVTIWSRAWTDAADARCRAHGGVYAGAKDYDTKRHKNGNIICSKGYFEVSGDGI